MPTTIVRVTKEDILDGLAGDCHHCPVAIATARATGGDAMLFEDSEYRLRIEVDGRSIVAPGAVRAFIRAFNDQPRDDEDGRLDVHHPDCRLPEPIEFELPAPSDPRWELACNGCGEYFADSELDEDGECEDCRNP